MAEAGSALFLHRDSTLVTSRISRPGRVESVRERVLLGGKGIDSGIVPADLEGVVEVLGDAMDHDDLAYDVHRRPAWNGCAGKDLKADGIDNVCCRATKRKYQPVLFM